MHRQDFCYAPDIETATLERETAMVLEDPLRLVAAVATYAEADEYFHVGDTLANTMRYGHVLESQREGLTRAITRVASCQARDDLRAMRKEAEA